VLASADKSFDDISKKAVASRFFLPTGIFIPLPSSNGIPLRYKWYTASYRSNSKSKPKPPIQIVTSGIPRYKLFIPLQLELKPLRNELKPLQ
jgi:hypothetical protein